MDRRSDAGFTLIELLVIILVLGILASIVVLASINLTNSSAISGCKADYKTVETAQEAYKGQVGAPATVMTEFEFQQPGQTGKPVGPWIKELPNSPYYTIGIAANGDITVSTAGHPALPGSGNCSFA